MNHRVTVRAVALAALIVAGCSPASLRVAQQPASACMDALAIGTLVASNKSGLALQAPDGTLSEMLWPFGYSARRDAMGLALLDNTGKVVAREGDDVQMGGGSDGNGIFEVCAGSVSVVAPTN